MRKLSRLLPKRCLGVASPRIACRQPRSAEHVDHSATLARSANVTMAVRGNPRRTIGPRSQPLGVLKGRGPA